MDLELGAQDAMSLRNAKNNRSLIEFTSDSVNRAALQFAAARFDDPLRHQCAGDRSRAVVCASLESVGSIRVHGMALSGLAHGDGIEPCGFDQYILRLVCDHRVEAAHDSRECDGPVRVG